MNRQKSGSISARLAVLLDIFSPWEGISLTYRQFAAELGKPITEASIKKWPQRKTFPSSAARQIVAKAQERGLPGVTVAWVLWGDGPAPQRGQKGTQTGPVEHLRPSGVSTDSSHGRFAEVIAGAMQADLSHNEFGEWSSIEVQHTVLWALKDLCRRLRALGFDMGKTFELTDDWAGKIGLPVRPGDRSADGEAET